MHFAREPAVQEDMALVAARHRFAQAHVRSVGGAMKERRGRLTVVYAQKANTAMQYLARAV